MDEISLRFKKAPEQEIFVKAFIEGINDNYTSQKTDVQKVVPRKAKKKSKITFDKKMVFSFDYIPIEKVMVVKKMVIIISCADWLLIHFDHLLQF